MMQHKAKGLALISCLAMVALAEAWVTTPRSIGSIRNVLPALSERGLGRGHGLALAGPTLLRMTSDDENGGQRKRKVSMIELLDDLLCQRAVQTQLDYFEEFRDGHKKGWLEDFRGHQGLTKVHAFGQLSDAREYLRSMLHEPPVTRDVEIGWGNRHNVGSKDNPYITRKKEMYTETIHPQKIVQGIMQIREQLVVEWIDDLALLEEEDQVFLEELEELRAGTNTTAINDERSVNIILSHCRAATRVSTPLRARNYDVLKKAGTWLTVQRMLEKEGRGKDMSWFSTWFAVNGEKLEGNSGLRESERFLRNLCSQPMRSVSTGPESLTMIDPTSVAKKIMAGRVEVVREWVEWLEKGVVQEGHTSLMRDLLAESFSSSKSPSQEGLPDE